MMLGEENLSPEYLQFGYIPLNTLSPDRGRNKGEGLFIFVPQLVVGGQSGLDGRN